MDFTLKEILAYLSGSSVIVGGLFIGIKYLYERLDLGKARKETAAEKAYNAVWKLYENAQKRVGELEIKIAALEQGDELSDSTVSSIYRAANKVGIEIDILETIFLKEMINCNAGDKLIEALQIQIEVLKQAHEKLTLALPK